MDVRIEIVGNEAVCRQDGRVAFSAPLKNFLMGLANQIDQCVLQEPIPEGVVFVRKRGNVTVVVVQEAPGVRTVNWLADDSKKPFGPGAIYRATRLSFPFVVLILAFRGGALTGQQQCFYRVTPICSLNDPLLLPNLHNVVSGYGQVCWLCLTTMRHDFPSLPWGDKLREIHKALWGAGFNKSAEVHEGTSYWTSLRSIDARVSSLDRWEKESCRDPFFSLRVPWRKAGKTVGEVIEGMITAISGPVPVYSAEQLVPLLIGDSTNRKSRWSWQHK